jgi:hypothetical protein
MNESPGMIANVMQDNTNLQIFIKYLLDNLRQLRDDASESIQVPFWIVNRLDEILKEKKEDAN